MSIKVFRQVVESGSFVGAADRMDISTAMVSKHVMHVEKRVGVRLLNRNSRTLSLTEPGRLYFERCKTILDDLESTELELGALGTTPRGSLRMTCPSWFAAQRMANALAEFRRVYPDIVVDVTFEDRRVDLVEEGFDMALRITRDPSSLPPGLIARPIRSIPVYIAASREFLKRNGTPKTLEDLSRCDAVGVGNLDALPFIGPQGRIEVPLRVVLRYRSMNGVANAVAAGIGVAPLPDTFFEEPVFKDKLVPVLTEFPFEEPTLYVLYVSRKYVPLKIRAFIDFLFERYSKAPPSAEIAAR